MTDAAWGIVAAHTLAIWILAGSTYAALLRARAARRAAARLAAELAALKARLEWARTPQTRDGIDAAAPEDTFDAERERQAFERAWRGLKRRGLWHES